MFITNRIIAPLLATLLIGLPTTPNGPKVPLSQSALLNIKKILSACSSAENKQNDTVHIRLSFTGDMLLASFKNETRPGNFNDYTNSHPASYFLENVAPIFEDDDFSIVNLETVLSDRSLSSVAKGYSPAYWYYSRTNNTDILTSSGIECVSLSNNHTGDYGQAGKEDTVAAVEAAGLLWGNSDKTLFLEKDGIRIALICNGLWSESQADQIISRIRAAEQESDYQIVFYHGGTERIHTPENWRIRASRKIVDNGADLVIGNHPHVLQPMESYNGTTILYSMGNFLFGDGKRFENRTIIYQADLAFNKATKKLTESNETIIPCYCYTDTINNYKPGIIENESEKEKVLSFLKWETDSP